MPVEPVKADSVQSPDVAPTTVKVEPANKGLSAKEPTALEKAMEMLMISQVNTQQMLGTINETMNKVVDGIDKINATAKANVDHQVDLDNLNKTKPFLVKIIFQVDQRTIDL